jgi:hypothetical protein
VKASSDNVELWPVKTYVFPKEVYTEFFRSLLSTIQKPMFVESHPTGNRSRFISGCDIDSILAFIDSKIEYFLLKQHYLRELKKEESKRLLLEKKNEKLTDTVSALEESNRYLHAILAETGIKENQKNVNDFQKLLDLYNGLHITREQYLADKA